MNSFCNTVFVIVMPIKVLLFELSNKYHSTIKFTAEISERETNSFDTNVRDLERNWCSMYAPF